MKNESLEYKPWQEVTTMPKLSPIPLLAQLTRSRATKTPVKPASRRLGKHHPAGGSPETARAPRCSVLQTDV
jgi:hypothetical protein